MWVGGVTRVFSWRGLENKKQKKRRSRGLQEKKGKDQCQMANGGSQAGGGFHPTTETRRKSKRRGCENAGVRQGGNAGGTGDQIVQDARTRAERNKEKAATRLCSGHGKEGENEGAAGLARPGSRPVRGGKQRGGGGRSLETEREGGDTCQKRTDLQKNP